MYKSRIRTWGLDKKLKENEARAIIHFLAQNRDKASYIQLRGRRVDFKAVESHFKRKGMAIGDVLSTDAPHVSNLIYETPDMGERGVPRCLSSPDVFKSTELLCADVREYVLSSFGTSRWLASTPDHYWKIDLVGKLFARARIHLSQFVYQPGMATMEEARKASVRFLDGHISQTFPVLIQIIAAILMEQPRPLARIMIKNLCFMDVTHDFRGSHINMYIRKVFTRIGQLAFSDEDPGYLLAVTRSSMDSYEYVLGQYHLQTLYITVTLSRIMSFLYGPDGLSEPLEALLSSLESQQGSGTWQSQLLRHEIRRLGNERDDRAELTRDMTRLKYRPEFTFILYEDEDVRF